MFAIEFKFRVALYPFPTVFIAAYSKSRDYECITAMFGSLTPILERAEKEYNAKFIVNEPTSSTHGLENAKLEQGVFLCSTLKFSNIKEMDKFLETVKP